ncbi:MAG: YncE family protein [Chitinophagaceae bacterium]
MKKISLVAIATFSILSSCKKNETMTMEKNITYPAAYVVNGESSTISVINLNTNTVTDSFELMNGSSMIMYPHHIYHHQSSTMHHLAVGVPGMDLSAGHTGGMAGMKGAVLLIDAVKGTIIKNIELPTMNHNAIYSTDGTEIWTTQMKDAGIVLIYDATSFVLKDSIKVGEEPAEVTFSSDGTKAYVCNGKSNTVSIINPITKAIISTVNVGTNPVGAWQSSINKMFVDNEDDGSISVIDVVSNINLATINLGFKPGYAAFNSSVNELWVSDATNGKIVYYKDMGSNSWMKHGEFVSGSGAHAIAFTNDGSTAYVTNQGANTVSVFKVSTHSKFKDLIVGKKPNGIVLKY